jgi:hypothetical protein
MHTLLYIFIACYTISCNAIVTIQASNLSCSVPTEINESAIIELDVPLEISGPGLCELIKAGVGFGPTDTITFTPTQSNIIELKSTVIPPTTTAPAQVLDPGIWDLRSFSSFDQQIIFEDVQVLLDPGATFFAGTVTMIFNGTSKVLLQPIT